MADFSSAGSSAYGFASYRIYKKHKNGGCTALLPAALSRSARKRKINKKKKRLAEHQ
jgi:hypothetical protein